jgi:hypothetical protein
VRIVGFHRATFPGRGRRVRERLKSGAAFDQTRGVPSRRRRTPTVKHGPTDPVEQFAALLRESAERERAEQERVRAEQERVRAEEQRARDAELAAAQHAADIATARVALDQAISDARAARRNGSDVQATDAAWRRAKARLIELETGAPPEWARPADRATDDAEAQGNP